MKTEDCFIKSSHGNQWKEHELLRSVAPALAVFSCQKLVCMKDKINSIDVWGESNQFHVTQCQQSKQATLWSVVYVCRLLRSFAKEI